MKFRFMLSIVAAVVMAGSAFAQTADPAVALKSITDFRTDALAKARAANQPANFESITKRITEIALEATKGVDPEKVDAKQGIQWAQLFQFAGNHDAACRSAERFIATKPEPAQVYAAHSLMLTSCNALKEGKMLMHVLNEVSPTTNMATMAVARSTAFTYAPTIQETVGLDAALAVLRKAEADVKAITPANDNEKTQQRGTIATVAEAYAEMLNDANRKVEAIAKIDDAVAFLGRDSREARSLTMLGKRMNMLGQMAPELLNERGYGSFSGLSALKGKVVLVDFFAHWCGPCIASFPDMKKMYADLKDKGLEIVGVTTYYGYYQKENTEKRDMPKDVEFAKMGEFIKKYELPWPVIYGDRTNFENYGITGIPHVAVIDKDGKMVDIKIGYSAQSFGAFRAKLEKMLESK